MSWLPDSVRVLVPACAAFALAFGAAAFGTVALGTVAFGTVAFAEEPGAVTLEADEIEYTEDGVDKTVQVGAADARMLALEINRARQAPGLRIAEHVDDEIAQAKEEAALALEEEERERAARS